MSFSDEELALIDAIHADPRNDAPRVSYADWCAANGLGELAELIRIHCRPPYFDLRISRTPPWKATLEPGFMDIEEDDPKRVRRSIELMESIYGSERLPENNHYEYFHRGLPLLEISTERHPGLLVRSELDELPLARFCLFLHAAGVADWLEHPFMQRVDFLRYYPQYDWEAEEPRQITEQDVHALIATPLIDRLREVGLCGTLTFEAAGLARDLLEARVQVDYTY